MYWKTEKYDNNMEILVTAANLVTFTGTVLSTGITADEHGKKYALAGALIDGNGNIVTQTGVSGSETLSSTPVGILYTNVNVTDGDSACSLVVEGYLKSDRVLDGFADKAIKAIQVALPNIKFR